MENQCQKLILYPLSAKSAVTNFNQIMVKLSTCIYNWAMLWENLFMAYASPEDRFSCEEAHIYLTY